MKQVLTRIPYPESVWFKNNGVYVYERRFYGEESHTVFADYDNPNNVYKTSLVFSKWTLLPLEEKEKWCRTIKGLLNKQVSTDSGLRFDDSI